MAENTFKKIADSIVDYAPGIAGLLATTGVGAPAAGVVGALGTLGKVFGLGTNAAPEAIHAAIQTNPESSLKLALAEMDFQLRKRDQDIEEMRVKMTPYLKELDTKTTPAVDAIHKLSRTILSVLCIGATVLLMLQGHEISPTVALILGGPATAYTLIKGKGNQTS